MNIKLDRAFDKDIDKINDKPLLQKLQDNILEIKKANDIRDIKNMKKMEGYKSFYRIRIGDYRIGVRIENDTIYFIHFRHRKDIYKVFP